MSTVNINNHAFDDTQGLKSRGAITFRCTGCGLPARIPATSTNVDQDITNAVTNLAPCPVPNLPPGLPVNPPNPNPPQGP